MTMLVLVYVKEKKKRCTTDPCKTPQHQNDHLPHFRSNEVLSLDSGVAAGRTQADFTLMRFCCIFTV